MKETNPYDSPQQTSGPCSMPRPVLRYWILSLLLFLIGGLVAIPGSILLNQEWQLIPTNTFLAGFEFCGQPVSINFVRRFSLGVGGALLISSAWLAAIGVRNNKHAHAVAPE